jgi:hypothetical protein
MQKWEIFLTSQFLQDSILSTLKKLKLDSRVMKLILYVVMTKSIPFYWEETMM